MEEEQAHAYYVDLRNKGSGAANFKEGLRFDKAGPGYADTLLSGKYTLFCRRACSLCTGLVCKVTSTLYLKCQSADQLTSGTSQVQARQGGPNQGNLLRATCR